MREEKTFRVVVFRFETDASTNYTRYMITKNYMPFFPGNQWLELKSIRKTSTGKEYAKKLVAFELVGFKKGHIRKCDKSPCARVLT